MYFLRVFSSRCFVFFFVVTTISLGSLLNPISALGAQPLDLNSVTDGAPLGASVRFAEDIGRTWTLDDAKIALAAGQFTESERDTVSLGYTDSVFWFHLSLQNSSKLTQNRFLQVGYPLLDRVVLTSLCGGGRSSYEVGDDFEFDKRPVQHRTYLFPVEVLPGETCEIFLSVATTSAMQVPITIWDPIALFEADQARIAAIMGLGGVLGIMAVYNLLILFSVRRRVYFYYVGFVLSILFVVLALNGASFQFFWPGSPWLADHSVGFLIPCTGFFVVRFTTEYLSLGGNEWGQSRVCLFINRSGSLLLLLAFATFFASYADVIKPVLVASFVVAVSCVAAGVLNWRAGSREAMLYTVSWLAFMVGALAIILAKLGLVAATAFTENGLALGAGLQVALLSFALADQLKTLERAKTKAERKAGELQQNLNAELESKLYLFSSVAHELNNPLNYISLGSEGVKLSAVNLSTQVESIFEGVERSEDVVKVESAFSKEFASHNQSLTSLQVGVRKVAEVISEMRGLTGVDGDSWYPISLSESLEQAIGRLEDALDPDRISQTSIDYHLNDCAGFACRVNPYLVVHAFRLVLLDAFDSARKDKPHGIHISAKKNAKGVQLIIEVNQSGREGMLNSLNSEPMRVAQQLITQTGGRLWKDHTDKSGPVDHYHFELDFKAPENRL